MRQPQRRQPRLSGHPQVVAGLRAVAPQSRAGGGFANGRDAEVERSARRVAADEVDAITPGAGKKSLGKRRQPGFVGLRQTAGEQNPARPRAHGGEVGKIDRQRFPAQLARVGLRQKMRAGNQHIGRDRQFHARRGRDQSAIVTGAERGLRRRAGKITVDQGKFGAFFRGHGAMLYDSATARQPAGNGKKRGKQCPEARVFRAFPPRLPGKAGG